MRILTILGYSLFVIAGLGYNHLIDKIFAPILLILTKI